MTAVQTLLAVLTFLAVNVASFLTYRKIDCTRDRQFTLSQAVVDKLKTIDPGKPTTVVVLQKRITSAGLSKSADALDRAAARKISEKVEDLVDQFREFGPQFKVTVLDVEDEAFEDKKDAMLKEIETRPGESTEMGKKNAAVLRAALDAAPEDSVVFYSEGKVQRLAFHEFYQLDRTASTTTVESEVDGKKTERTKFTNLVLLPQGTEVFANRLDRLDAKKPKVGLLVIHQVLTTKGEGDEYNSAGLRKSLEANGFEVIDVITRKWGRGGEPPATVSTVEESELERTENRVRIINRNLDALEINRKGLSGLADRAKTESLPELDRVSRQLFRRPITKDEDREWFTANLKEIVKEIDDGIKAQKEQLDKVLPKYNDLLKDERAVEGLRLSDLKAKLASAVADCDLLIIPRLTVMDAGKGIWIPPNVYNLFNLVDDQAAAVKAFVKAGKPVMVCFGPTSIGEGMPVQPDEVERIFNRFGVVFGNQTVISDTEARGIAERRGELLATGDVEVPPLLVVRPPDTSSKKENPVATAFETTARSAAGGKLEVKKSGFRPVSVRGPLALSMPYVGEIVQLGKESWNESKLIGDEDYVPQMDQPKLNGDNATRGTLDEERKGPHTVGVAVEGAVPVDWFDPRPGALAAGAAVLAMSTPGLPTDPGLVSGFDPNSYAQSVPPTKRPTVRLVAFGHGGMFNGNTLDPAVERLMLHSANWQLKRDDRLPKPAAETKPWQFPRVTLSPFAAAVWWYGAAVLPPIICGLFGVFVLTMRKVR